MNESHLETFYVYKSLHSDESWGAILGGASVNVIPNIAFGMTIYAKHEKEAISRARDLYERIHYLDNDKRNVREFAKEALNSVVRAKLKGGGDIEGKEEEIAKSTMRVAVEMNREFERHFEDVGGREIQRAKDAIDYERRPREREIDLHEGSNDQMQRDERSSQKVLCG